MVKKLKVLLILAMILSILIPGVAMAKDFSDVAAGSWGQREIQEMADLGFIAGFPDGRFYPDKAVTRAQFAAIIINSLKLTVDKTQQETFKDVSKVHWAFPFVEAASKAGFINGYQGFFRPDDLISREEMAVVVMKVSKKYGYSGDGSTALLGKFKDKDRVSSWAAPDLSDAVKFGYLEEVDFSVQGSGPSSVRYNRVLAPRDPAARAQAAAAVHRVLKKAGII